MRYFFYPLIILTILLEIFFQIIFILDIKTFKKTILFFNPYCDQIYWDYEGNSTFDNKEYSYHPILTLIKKKNEPMFDPNISKNYSSKKDGLIFYGSSFIDHKYFIANYKDEINYAIKSYGLDQIHKSYMLTKDKHSNKNIIIGFLLEDIDRILFNQRNFPKLKYKKINQNYEITNTPIKFDNIKNKKIVFYTYNLVKNLIFLTLNEYDYKKSECQINLKKDIFKFFIDSIILNSKKLNQNIIFITFIFESDIMSPNWRYLFVKEYFSSKNITHLDTIKIIKEDINKNDLNTRNYYSLDDFHLNKYGFNVIIKNLDTLIKQYK